MKVKIEKIDWHLSKEIREGTVIFSIDGISYQAFSCGPDYKIGNIIEVEISHMEGKTEWEEIFGKNIEKKKCLIGTGEWSYDAYGQIISISPIMADFGPFVLDLGNWTHDERVIGEFIFWRISRLDIFPK